MAEGLEGVVAATTRLSHVDGAAGRLTIAGYAVEDLAPHAAFEEVAYLLLHGALPEPRERSRFAGELASRRALPAAALHVLREAAEAKAPPMDALRMAAGLLTLGAAADPLDEAMTAIASFPTIVGSYWRMLHGDAPHGEGGREELRREADAVQQQRRVELDVGVEPALGLALVQHAQRRGFDGLCERIQPLVAAARVEPLGRAR